MKLTEGKSPITFEGYLFLATLSLNVSTDFNQNIFSHVYLIFCWNLMARSISVAGLMYSHLHWENDALIVTLPKHKGD
jgi:hypothetical protein